MNTKQIGDFGEKAAAEYLEANGYEILKRNFRLKFGEVDIVARKDGCTVFVEVKTRRNTLHGSPAEFVDYRKQLRIKKAAACFADLANDDVRFDVVEVIYDAACMTAVKINHIENAF